MLFSITIHPVLIFFLQRYDPQINWNNFKESFIGFINHYKVLKIKEEREFIYTGGKLFDFVNDKYEKLNYLYPTVNESTKIRMIISSFQDENLVKEFSKIVTNNLGLFMRHICLYDKQNFPSTNAVHSINYNIADYYTNSTPLIRSQEPIQNEIRPQTSIQPTAPTALNGLLMNDFPTGQIRNLAMTQQASNNLANNDQNQDRNSSSFIESIRTSLNI